MATFVEGGVDAFNAYAFSQPTEQDMNLFAQNNKFLYETIAPSSTSHGFFDRMRNQLESVDFSRLKEYAAAAARKISSFWEDDNIRPLNTLVDLQFPPNCMIRWQMANPDVRQLYQKELCAGYGDKYFDFDPGAIGENHHDWRMVMHGMEQYDKEGRVYWTSYDETFDDCEEESVNRLTMAERIDIIGAWNRTSHYIELGRDDPTSQYSGML